MEKFVASDGVEVVANVHGDEDGYQTWQVGAHRGLLLSDGEVQALREFFQHERDEELGRWRSKLDPNWTGVEDERQNIVRFRNDDGLREFTVHLETRQYGSWTRDLQKVAREYLAAHPEPKPWHDAKPGEVWVLTYRNMFGFETTKPAMRTESGKWRLPILELDFDEAITAARRIYPEGVSGD